MDRERKRDSWDPPSARRKTAMDTFRAEPVWTEDTCDVYGSYYTGDPPTGDLQTERDRDLYPRSEQHRGRKPKFADRLGEISSRLRQPTDTRNVPTTDSQPRRGSPKSHPHNYQVPTTDMPVSGLTDSAEPRSNHTVSSETTTDLYYVTYDPSRRDFYRRHTAHSKTSSQDSGVESNQDDAELSSPFHRRHTVPVPEGSIQQPTNPDNFQDKEELERLNRRLSERIRILEDKNRVLQTHLQDTSTLDGEEISHMFDSWEEGEQRVKFSTLKRGRLMPEVRESLELTISRWEAAAQEYKTRWEEEESCRKECEAKLLERERDLYDARRETQEAQLKVRRLQDSVQNFEGEVAKLREELKDARNHLRESLQPVENGTGGNYDKFAADMADALQEIREEYDVMAQQKIQETEAFYKSQMDTLSSTVNVNHKKLEDATAKIRKHRAEVDSLKKEKRELKVQNEKIQEKLREAESSRHAQSEKYETTISELEKNLARLRDEMIEQHINSHNVNLALKRDVDAYKKIVEGDPHRLDSLSAMLSPPHKKQTNEVFCRDVSTSPIAGPIVSERKEVEPTRKDDVIDEDIDEGEMLPSSEKDIIAVFETNTCHPPDIIPLGREDKADDTQGNTAEETNYSLTDFWTPKSPSNHQPDAWPAVTLDDVTSHVSPPRTLQPTESTSAVTMVTLSDDRLHTMPSPVNKDPATDWATLLSPRQRITTRRCSLPATAADLTPPQPLMAPRGHDHIRYLLGGYRVQLPQQQQRLETQVEDESGEEDDDQVFNKQPLFHLREVSERLRSSEILSSLKVEDEEDDHPAVGPNTCVPHLTGKWLEDSYFSIVCRSTGHALDILPPGCGDTWVPGGGDGSRSPSAGSRKFKHGANVVMAERQERSDSQMWYYITGAIVNKATNYVLTVKDDKGDPGTPVVVCSPSKREGQHWTVLADGHILSQLTGFCLTVELLTSPWDLGHVMMAPHQTQQTERQIWDIMASETAI
ncbi:uncharacterized protein [Branchiostoma lanceolatum]|uniref:uncharacterized protein isoform X1 n=1 Tax=Branchiostoma lanceolatum TaxID=7740 RepID=UPI00345414B2